MGFDATGRLHTKGETVQITERFRKREFVLELEAGSQYPQTVQFQLTGDRCESLDQFEVGQDLGVEFSLRGREWTSPKGEIRFFNSLDVWVVRPEGPAPEKLPTPEDNSAKAEEAGLPDPNMPAMDDNIPF